MTVSDVFEMPITVAVKDCGCLDGDLCSCACQSAIDRIELDTVSGDPIVLPPHAPGLVPLVDRALVGRMAPPNRWSVTDGGVSVSLGVNP